MKRWFFVLSLLLLGALIGTAVTGSVLQGQAPAVPVVPRELTSYRDVVKKVLPAVVSIEARQTVKTRMPRSSKRPGLDESQLPEEFRRYFKDLPGGLGDLDGEAQQQPQLGMGSGFLVDPKGVILTNYHVVDGADQVEVKLTDGRKFLSKDIKSDPKTDLAIVRIDAKEPLPYLELGDSTAMEIGDRVLAVGAPFGLAGSVTHGIISAKGRALNVNLYEDFLQTDAAINPGNSGGPLVNLEGKVIGINSAIKSRSGGFQGVGLAISSNMARNVMEQLEHHGVVRRGYLGVQIKDVDNAEVAAKLGLKEARGAMVTQVFDNSPAAKAGLQGGDVIVSLNNKPVKDGRDLQSVVATMPIGQPADLAVVRDGKEKALKVTIEEQPQQFGSTRVPTPSKSKEEKDAVTIDKVGMEVTDLTPELAESLGFKDSIKGVVVSNVEPDGLAAQAGLKRGVLVTKVDRKPVSTAAEFKKAVEGGSLKQGVLLQVRSSQGGTGFLVLKSGS
jgi:serine protease Do